VSAPVTRASVVAVALAVAATLATVTTRAGSRSATRSSSREEAASHPGRFAEGDAVAITGNGAIRAGATRGASVVEHLEEGALARVVRTSGTWVLVDTGVQQGWIAARSLRAADASRAFAEATAESVQDVASVEPAAPEPEPEPTVAPPAAPPVKIATALPLYTCDL
jgi:hypothetical protein